MLIEYEKERETIIKRFIQKINKQGNKKDRNMNLLLK